MCGIAGFVDKGVQEDTATSRIDSMLDKIRHRGPDGHGSYFDSETGLCIGMRRLSIIDLPGGNQPMWNEDNTVSVVFNGEIYNYVELRKELVRRGHQLKTQSDTEVLVHLYEDYGAEMFSHLRGMFAFALYDKNKRHLLIARDHFGQKPLYYSLEKKRFAFGSEIKSLWCLPYVNRDINDSAFFDYISWFSLQAPDTHFQTIKKLSPGSFVLIDLNNPIDVSERKFWSFQTSDDVIDDMDEAVKQLDKALRESIEIHLRSDVPVGILLSSGLDSRAIAAYAKSILGNQIKTFSVGFDTGDSELKGARLTANELVTEHFEITLTANDLATSIRDITWHMDEPVADPAAFAVLKVSELAKNHVKVLLGGEGADELFAGYSDRYLGIVQTMKRSDHIRAFLKYFPRYRKGFPHNRWERARLRASLSPGAELAWLRVEGLPGNILHPQGLDADQFNRLLDRCEVIAKRAGLQQRGILEDEQAFDLSWQLPESLLVKADRMSMAASIELRAPFLDLAVAAVAASVDSSLKLSKDGIGKLVLRRCLEQIMPEGLVRPKKGFPVPLNTWLRGPLRERIEEEVLASGSPVYSFLDHQQLENSWRMFILGENKLAHVFYALWQYVTWSEMLASIDKAA